jgi:hypothetical protein
MGFFNRLKSASGAGKPSGPPSAADVAGRAYALNAVVLFAKTIAGSGKLSSELGTLPADEAKAVDETAARVAAKVVGAAKRFDFLSAFAPSEAALFVTPFSKLGDQALFDATWRMEAFQAIVWSLGLVKDMPGYDQQADDALFGLLALEKFTEFAATAELRDAAALEKARSLAELWHWRSRTRQLIEERQPFPEMPQFKSYDEIVRFTAKAAKQAGTVAEIIDEDFAVGGKAFRDLSPEQWSKVQSLAAERHHALNWVCGRAPGNRWDETPSET